MPATPPTAIPALQQIPTQNLKSIDRDRPIIVKTHTPASLRSGCPPWHGMSGLVWRGLGGQFAVERVATLRGIRNLQPSTKPCTPNGAKVAAPYPADGLDFKTRRYIDDLRQRNTMLEAAMRELKQQVLAATEDRPLDLEKMLKAGPDDGLAMKMVPSQPVTISQEAKAAILALTIDLPNKVAAVELYKGKALRLRTGEWLVTPAQYTALIGLIARTDADLGKS